LNALHFDTRHDVIRRELLFAEGDRFDPHLLAETERNLRSLGFLNKVVVAPVDTSADGDVRVRISAHETWSLETSLSFSLASDKTSRWSLAFSEDNFLGRGLQLGLNLGADENGDFYSVFLRERRLFGSYWRLQLFLTDRSDGYVRQVRIERPFFNQAQSWGIDFAADGSLQDERYYLSNAGSAGADPARLESLYGRFPYLREGVALTGLNRVGDGESWQVWRIGLGISVRRQQADLTNPVVELSDDRFVDLSFLEEEGSPLARDNGWTVWPQLVVTTETRHWAKERFVLRYGVVEDLPLGSNASLRIGPAGPAVGSTSGNGERVKAWLQGNEGRRLMGGYLLASYDARATFGRAADQTWRVDLTAGWLTHFGDPQRPWHSHVIAEAGRGKSLLGSEAFVLGLQRGLRTLGFDGQAGDRLYRWNVEQGKVLPFDLFGFFNLGLAGFYSGGSAWFEDEDHGFDDTRHEAGFGVRLGSTRSSRAERTRLDVSWALDGSEGPVFTAVTQGFF
jgi:hypothetical protein